jgi:hypothetical protein
MLNMKQLLFTLIAFLSVTATTFHPSANVITLTGRVFDSKNEPLVGVSIVWKGTTTGTVSDVDGNFRLDVSDKADAVVFSYIGFTSKELKIKDFTPSKTANNVFSKDIILEENASVLEEVVVTGYSVSSAKKSVVYSVATVSSSDLTHVSAKAAKDKVVSSALAGKVAGVCVTSEKTVEKRDVLKKNKDVLAFAKDLDLLKKKTVVDDDEDIEPEPSAGQLTAGEWSDLKNWDFWQKSLTETFEPYVKNWKMNLTQRYSLILRGSNEQPIPDATVQLMDKDSAVIWSAKTDNQGRAELFANAFGKTSPKRINVQFEGKTYNLSKIKNVDWGVNKLKIPVACGFSPTLDIAFVVDATGSMGDEISYLKAELADVIRQVKRDNRQLNVRLGSVFYRDFGDAYLTRTFPFDKSLKKNVEFIKNQSAGGGGDFPEAVPEGLEAAIDSMDWSDKALARLLFLVLDAPPHLTDENVAKLQRLAAKAAQKGIRIIPIASSGVDKETEYLMKIFAVATGGTYTFLTNDSGIGNDHLEATTEKFEVELLNALLVRLIKQYSSYEACNDLATEATTGGDTQFGQNFQVYPNPVRDVLNLEFKTAGANVFITNAQGQTVRKLGIFTEGVQSIDVRDLSNGVYFVHFQKEGVVCSKKISVVK